MSAERVAIFSGFLHDFHQVLANASGFRVVFLFISFNAVSSGQNCSSTVLEPK